jgi:hypothetical protein
MIRYIFVSMFNVDGLWTKNIGRIKIGRKTLRLKWRFILLVRFRWILDNKHSIKICAKNVIAEMEIRKITAGFFGV